MNFRRKHNRDHGARSRSSDWRYPQTVKGDDSRSRYSTKRRATSFEEDLAEWMKDPEFAEAYNKARAEIEAEQTRLTSSVG